MKMRILLLALAVLCLLGNSIAKAGKDPTFKTVWEAQFPFAANLYAASNSTGDRIIGSQQNEFCLLDGMTGKLIWHHKFKDVSNGEITMSNFQMVIWDANILLVFDNKLGKDRVAAFELKEGKMLWLKDKYQWTKPGNEGLRAGIEDMVIYMPELEAFAFTQKESLTLIKVKTGEEVWETTKFKGSVAAYIFEDNDLLMINYKPTAVAALFSAFKNQLVRINPNNGEIKWETTYTGSIEKTVITREALVSLKRKGDKLFLEFDGLQVFDFSTGKNLWGAAYESNMELHGMLSGYVPGEIQAGGIYGAIAEPLIVEGAIYLVLGSGAFENKYIEKRDLETGRVLWTSEKIKQAKALPCIAKVGDKIICQIGGFVNVQATSKERKKTDKGMEITTHTTNRNVWMDKFAVAAINDGDGKFAWRSEKFKDRIANMTVVGNTVFTASGIAFYSIDAASGRENYEIDMEAAKVGKGQFTFDIGDAICVVCEKGIVAYNKADGKQKYATNAFKNVMRYKTKGENIFLQNGKADVAGLVLTDGSVKGIVNAKTSIWYKNDMFASDSEFKGGVDMTDDGEYIFVFNRKDIVKLKVND